MVVVGPAFDEHRDHAQESEASHNDQATFQDDRAPPSRPRLGRAKAIWCGDLNRNERFASQPVSTARDAFDDARGPRGVAKSVPYLPDAVVDALAKIDVRRLTPDSARDLLVRDERSGPLGEEGQERGWLGFQPGGGVRPAHLAVLGIELVAGRETIRRHCSSWTPRWTAMFRGDEGSAKPSTPRVSPLMRGTDAPSDAERVMLDAPPAQIGDESGSLGY